MRPMSSRKCKVFYAVATLTLIALPAAARQGWDCTYEGNGGAAGHYVTRLERRGSELVEPRWPNSSRYRILVDGRDMLIAAQGDAEGPSFRRGSRGTATIIMLDKLTGRLRRSTGMSGDETDQVDFGRCVRF